MEKFIITKSDAVAEKLKDLGYYEVAWDGVFYTFVNNGLARFSDEEMKEITFSNILRV